MLVLILLLHTYNAVPIAIVCRAIGETAAQNPSVRFLVWHITNPICYSDDVIFQAFLLKVDLRESFFSSQYPMPLPYFWFISFAHICFSVPEFYKLKKNAQDMLSTLQGAP